MTPATLMRNSETELQSLFFDKARASLMMSRADAVTASDISIVSRSSIF